MAGIGAAGLLLLVFIAAPLAEIVFEATRAGFAPMLATFADRERGRRSD